MPGHSDITGNERADKEAKKTTRQSPQFITISYTDWYPYIHGTTIKLWSEECERKNTVLRKAKDTPGKWKKEIKTHREEVVINRLRLTHTRLTHEHIFEGNLERAICRWCDDARLIVEHLLVTCKQLEQLRNEVMRPRIRGTITLQKLLREGMDHRIEMEYLTRLSIVHKI